MLAFRPRLLTVSSFLFCSMANALRASFSSAGESLRVGMVSSKETAATLLVRSR